MKKLFLSLITCIIVSTAYGQFTYKTAPGETFGYTPGSFGISDAGSVSYTVPIVLSPGSSGMAPRLALNYSNVGNNSIMGNGWSLQGLSAITRAAQTYAQDGQIVGVNLTQTDRFALDGGRLIPKNPASTYGNDGTEYITEQQSFSKVVQHNGPFGTASAPSYFIVYTKSGLIMEYGNSADSKIMVNSIVPVFWLLNKVTDTKGNYYTITYSKDDHTGEYYPDHMDYTGNTNASILTYCSVKFTYEPRLDTVVKYFLGSPMVSFTKRISAISNFYQDKLVRSYHLSYQYSPNKVSELAAVTEFGSDGTAHRPTQFRWNHIATPKYKQLQLSNVPCAASDTLISLDINSDGVMDIVKFSQQGNIEIYKGNKDTANLVYKLLPTNIPIPRDKNTRYLFGDFNGDGRIDIFLYKGGNSQMYINQTRSTGTVADFTRIDNPINIPNPYPQVPITQVIAVDFNGDGRSDLMTISAENGTNITYFSQMVGYSTFSYIGNAASPNLLPSSEFYVPNVKIQPNFVDINGDGLTDVLFFNPNNGSTHIYLNKGGTVSSFTNNVNNPITPSMLAGGAQSDNCAFYLQDMNGDGLPDILYKDAVNNRLKYWVNKGDFTFDLLKTIAPEDIGLIRTNFSQALFYFSDFNADGNLDIMYRDGNIAGMTNTPRFFLNDGKMNLTDQALPFGFFTMGFQIIGFGNFSQKSNSDFCIASYDLNPTHHQSTPYTIKIFRGEYSYNNLITEIRPGSGQTYHLHYDYLCDDAIYEKNEDAIYPMIDYQASHFVISKYSTDDGIGGKKSVSYKFAGARIQVDGRGFRGFSKIQSRDDNTGTTQTKVLYNEIDSWKYAGSSVIGVTTALANGTVVSQTDIQNGLLSDGTNSFFAYPASSTTKTFELDGTMINQIGTRQAYDKWGNVIINVTDRGEGFVDSLKNTYTNDEGKWQLGRLTASSLYRQSDGAATIIKTSGFTFDVDGLMTAEIADPDSSSFVRIEKDYSYDSFGNITVSSTRAWNGTAVETHTIKTSYDSLGRFINITTNPLNQSIYTTNEPLLGHVLSKKDINALITIFNYDGFGRLIRTTLPDGNWIAEECKTITDTISAPQNSSYVLYRQASNAPPETDYFDLLDRQIRQVTKGFNGEPIYKDILFDKNGYQEATSLPYFPGKPIQYSRFYYDDIGRQIKVIQPDNSQSTTIYQGRKTIQTNALGQRKIVVTDASQRVVSVEDNLGNLIRYIYDSAGSLIQVVEPAGVSISFSYDSHGYKKKMVDPDLGTYTYVTNSFGQVIRQNNDKGELSVMTYDLLGRPLQRTIPEGVTSYVYDQGPHGKGMLTSVSNYDGYRQANTYDTLCRVSKEEQRIKGKLYIQSYRYNPQGKVKQVFYPSGFSVLKIYNDNGYLYQIKDAFKNRIYWTAKALNACGQVERQNYGNHLTVQKEYDERTTALTKIRTLKNRKIIQQMDYQYDEIGNLLYRQDSLMLRKEIFAYDGLNRLTKSKILGLDSVIVSYNNLGNIARKSDVGDYTYGTALAGPHELKSITNNGHSTSVLPGVTITYNSFNKARELTNGNYHSNIFYNCQQQRYYQELFRKRKLIKTKIYVNAFMEQEIVNRDTLTTNYITNPEGIFAVFTHRSHCPLSLNKLQYCLHDNQGSLIMVTNRVGHVVNRYNFDAWGKRRNADWTTPLKDKAKLFKDRGYTGHEHYDLFDIIDMNGRLYDPSVGRFTTADPNIQDVTDLQTFNRFSYGSNNPLKYVDPSGYFLGGIGDFFGSIGSAIGGAVGGFVSGIAQGFASVGEFAAHIASISANWIGQNWQTVAIVAVAIVATVATGGAGLSAVSFWGAVGSGAAVGFATSTVSTLLAGGNIGTALSAGIKGAVIGGITAGATFEVGEVLGHVTTSGNILGKVAGHGVIQGLATVADGGKFIHGFYAGGITPIGTFATAGLANGLEKVVAASVIGGTTSELSGGKFANGAVSAVFVEMYNENAGVLTGDAAKGHEIFENAGRITSWGESISSFYELRGVEYMEGLEKGCGSFGYAMSAGAIVVDLSQQNYEEAAWDATETAFDIGVSRMTNSIGTIYLGIFGGAAI